MDIIWSLTGLGVVAALYFGLRKRPVSAAREAAETKTWADGFSLNIVGESRCQSEVRKCKPGELVQLLREPDNPHDAMAVRVLSQRGKPLGYLSRDRAQWLGRKIDNGAALRSEVERVTGQGEQSRGIVLKVWLVEEGV